MLFIQITSSEATGGSDSLLFPLLFLFLKLSTFIFLIFFGVSKSSISSSESSMNVLDKLVLFLIKFSIQKMHTQPL